MGEEKRGGEGETRIMQKKERKEEKKEEKAGRREKGGREETFVYFQTNPSRSKGHLLQVALQLHGLA